MIQRGLHRMVGHRYRAVMCRKLCMQWELGALHEKLSAQMELVRIRYLPVRHKLYIKDRVDDSVGLDSTSEELFARY